MLTPKERPILFSAPMVRALLDGSKTQTRRVMVGRGAHKGSTFADTNQWCRIEADGTWIGWDPGFSTQEEANAFTQRAYKGGGVKCPYGAVGDRLWVRETWFCNDMLAGELTPVNRDDVYYRADGEAQQQFPEDGDDLRWRPSLFMPRWASRITLEITDVRVQRLQEISEADAIAEGVVWSEPTEADREWMRGRAEEEGSDVRDLDGVWLAPGTRQGYGPPHLRNEPRWAPTARGAYRWLWESINGAASWDANPWVWALTFRTAAGC